MRTFKRTVHMSIYTFKYIFAEYFSWRLKKNRRDRSDCENLFQRAVSVFLKRLPHNCLNEELLYKVAVVEGFPIEIQISLIFNHKWWLLIKLKLRLESSARTLSAPLSLFAIQTKINNATTNKL